MKTKLLTSAILLAVTSTAAHAVSINMRHEWSPEFKDNAENHKDRIAVSHRFKNGIGFEVESKYASGENAFDIDEFKGNGQQANISYRMKLDDSFTLTPQYKWETSDSKAGHQFNLTLGYKINDDWSTSFRHRYHYEVKNSGDDNSHYNRWTVGLGYKGIQDWSLSASTDYTWKQEGEDVWKGDSSGFTEINFKAEYKWVDGWSPFAEFGVTPATDKTKASADQEKDSWRPRLRVGMKYSF